MQKVDYLMGKMPEQEPKGTKNIDLLITEDCNLRCHYCYLVGKNNKNIMSFDIAKKAVDFILTDKSISDTPFVVWQMGGAEALMEVDLIDQITEYIKSRMKELDHHWKDNYMFSIASNGLLYSSPKVQRYLAKNAPYVNISITIDGTKEKHDKARVFADGSGSYDKVLENVKLWMEQNPYMQKVTKATFSHEDLPYLKDSVINLWNIGIKYVMANVVFEDVWEEGDDILFENQIKELADYTIDNGLWKDHAVRFFDPNIGFPMSENEINKGFCGSGKHMLSIDSQGRIYPCNRFTGFSLSNKEPLPMGDIYNGIYEDKYRTFVNYNLKSISNQECLNCQVASGCACCAGFNYDSSDTDTVYQRATNICKMHKANVRACEYFWNKFKEVTGLKSLRDEIKEKRDKAFKLTKEPKTLLFILNDAVTPHCYYDTLKDKAGNINTGSREMHKFHEMSLDTFNRGLAYADKYNFIPIFIGDNIHKYIDNTDQIKITSPHAPNIDENNVIVFDERIDNVPTNSGICIVHISKDTVDNLCEFIGALKNSFGRINIMIKDIACWSKNDVDRYKKQLDKLVEMVASDIKNNCHFDINILSDIIKTHKMDNCDAGEQSFTLSPDGMVYICPAFYFEQPSNPIASLDEEITVKNGHLLNLEHAPICSQCDAYHCSRCKYLNLKTTGEINIPSKMQCIISHIERETARNLQLRLKQENLAAFMDILPELDYNDPFDKIVEFNNMG